MGETRSRRTSRSRSTRATARNTSRGDDAGDGQTPERTSRARRGRHSRDATESTGNTENQENTENAGGQESPAPAVAEPLVRLPAAQRVGRRRVVGPLIGADLARQLLDEHQPDVLLEQRCGCGLADPCPARAFFGGFFAEDAHAAVMAGAGAVRAGAGGAGRTVTAVGPVLPGRRTGPSETQQTVTVRPAAASGGSGPNPDAVSELTSGAAPGATEPVAGEQARPARTGRRPAPRHSSPEPEPAVDLDATQQIPVVPADPPPVAVAV